jgi:hypothetical protein
LAIDFANPWIESERRDALAVSARAIACLRSDGPLHPRSEGRAASPPNHCYKNRCALICRESGEQGSQYFFGRYPRFFGARCRVEKRESDQRCGRFSRFCARQCSV